MNRFDVATLARHPRVFVVLREDHQIKPGGDVDLARHIARDVEAAGGRPVLVTARDLSGVGVDDALVLFNIDRPFDAVTALAKVPEACRALLYCLHHPAEGVAKYLRGTQSGTRGVLARRAGYRPDRYETLVDVAKGAARLDARRIAIGLRRRQGIRQLMDRCELLVVAAAEMEAIEAAYGPARQAAAILPHPPVACAERLPTNLLRYILIPGRIEPRKNQLAAIENLARSTAVEGRHVVVVGGPGSDRVYFDAVVQACLAAGFLYLSQLPKTLFYPVTAAADLVINPSYVEVTSLIDLFAMASGIPLITTRHAWYEANATTIQVDPEAWRSDPVAIDEAVRQALMLA